jgi:hypothetical protein
MKTPREILLKQHQSVEPQLDRMWVKELAPELRSERTPAHENVLLVVGWKLWRELIWPCRRVWAGVACAWLLIVGLNVASVEPARQIASKAGPRSSEEMQVLIEQRRMLAQLTDWPTEPAKTRKSNPPGPRSERTTKISAA